MTPPRKPPMKKMYIVAIAVPMPRSRYGTHRPHHRADHRERARRQHGLRDVEEDEQRLAVRREPQRREERRRQDQQADDRQRLGRVLAVHAVEVAADEREERAARRCPLRLRMTPRRSTLSTCDRVVEVERRERALAEQSEARARRTRRARCGSSRIRFSRANAASIEIGAGFSSSVICSPSTSSFSNCPRGGSFMKNASDPTIDDRDAEDDPGPAPALGAAGPRTAIAPTSTGLARPRPWPIMLLSADIRARTPIG